MRSYRITSIAFISILCSSIFSCEPFWVQDPCDSAPECEIDPIQYVPNEIVVWLKDPLTEEKLVEKLPQSDTIKIFKRCPCSDQLWTLEIEPELDLDEVLGAVEDDLDDLGEGNQAFLNFYVNVDLTNEIVFDSINVLEAKPTDESSEIVIAVIDGGIDSDNSALSDLMWHNAGELLNVDDLFNENDDDGNCYVDDFFGFDFVYGPSQEARKLDSHGTEVSLLIANNISGVTPRFMDLRIFDENGEGKFSNGLCAIDYAIKNKASIINASWGYQTKNKEIGPSEIALKLILDKAFENDILLAAAAGNDSLNNDCCPQYPSQFQVTMTNVISVAAIDKTTSNALANYSNFGPNTVGVAAVGTYPEFYGTSYATPLVVARAAELKSSTSLTSQQIIECIVENAIDIGAPIISEGKLDVTSSCTPNN